MGALNWSPKMPRERYEVVAFSARHVYTYMCQFYMCIYMCLYKILVSDVRTSVAKFRPTASITVSNLCI